ncbi:acyl-CoA dehydrogenase family protein [Didymella exigua CBS 183.55]|uniref:Acyl-CoA dehydrogenase family protein n=1 Tax=Didymella exigua CBS 183.55 TaxID=1150837 RepID=A0A6A5RN04_9PLEO|nr:acyl-CoA dehydrogenase family protein [Didymella exigua CBS 183.55]KAF1929019.1 acyl-CoA dehydrogenase family protein [Didymella exigua CBS 183.55]
MSGEALTRDAVAKHNTPEDLWCIVDHKVYDLTDFADAHPGGSVVLEQVAGTDATTTFYNLHRQEVLQKYSDLCIGTIEGEKSEVIVPQPGDLSPVPYAEPLWLRPQFKSPYFKESHRKLRKEMRIFIEKEVRPVAQECEKSGEYIPQELIDKMAANHMLAMRLGPGKHLHGKNLLGVVKGEEFDYLHDLVQAQESVRVNARGFTDGNMAGMTISLTAVLQWMPEGELKTRVVNEVLSGKKKMCLAVTEAFAGSDVAGLRTTATLTPDGKHYIVRGTKKWITNGMFCDYFVTACKTEKGFSVLLVERDENLSTKLIKTAYSTTAGTSFVEYNDCKVPVEHLLGKHHQGFAVIMANFNHERFMLACAVIRHSRTIVEECLKWCNQRVVFGKKLVEQPAMRQKLAEMISLVEANQAWLESIAYQMSHMSYDQQSKLLGGPIGLLKSYSTRSAHEIADRATNIFGGRGLTQSGMGKYIEEFHRTYKFDAILGGTEEVLADLGVRQAYKNFPKSML